MIRCGSEYRTVILVTPADAGPDDDGAKFYRYSWDGVRGQEPETFQEISRNSAIRYFSGIADGLGFANKPSSTFPNLDVAGRWIRQRQPPTEAELEAYADELEAMG